MSEKIIERSSSLLGVEGGIEYMELVRMQEDPEYFTSLMDKTV